MERAPLPTRPILVAGIGRAGEAALQLLTRTIGVEAVSAWDAMEAGDVRARAARWRARGVRVTLGGDGTDALRCVGPSATIVKSPGIDLDVPLLRVAAEQNMQVLDELEIGWRASARPLVGVTGTNGKSTTCALIASQLCAAGCRAQRVGNTEFGPPLSGADPAAIPVCEVSSFQLQAAPTFLPEIAIFTNLSLEHLPRHKTMEAYADTKQLMFVRDRSTCGIAVVNIDDDCGKRIAAAVQKRNGHLISYGFSPGSDIQILKARWTMREAETLIRANGRVTTVRSRLPGRHNALNIAAAIGYGWAAGLDMQVITVGLETAVAPPGRGELIDEGQGFDVIVDYAHTPDGISQFLGAVRAVTSARKTMLHTVFGPVGLPDPPKMRGCAEVAAALSDNLILTTGSAPRSHRIQRLRELRDAARSVKNVELVLDRRRAIERAVEAGRPGDVVSIIGIGALGRLVIDPGGTVCPFDDREVARDALRALARCSS